MCVKLNIVVYVVHILHALCKPHEGWTSIFMESVDKKLNIHVMSRQEENPLLKNPAGHVYLVF